jgi:hypothetical protein
MIIYTGLCTSTHMAEQSITFNINLDALRGELQRSLQEVIYLVSAGLQTKDQITPEILQLPTNSIKMKFDSGLNWSSEKAQEQYSEWVLSNGFRDTIENLGAFLESAHGVLSFWELVGRQEDGTDITGADWNEVIVDGKRRFNRLGLPDKLEHIKNQHAILFDETLGSHVLSINMARNCLVHRDGIVSDRDITTDNALEVQWRRMVFLVKNEDGEKELFMGEVIEAGSEIGFRQEDKTKSFVLGSKIEFTVQEFSDICWCLFLFGDELVHKISDYGVEKEFITERTNS